ncbi:MAG: hypothetical protein BroJett011_71820 [Chloroflexota bacterium]|nr:MAG: hypothetical protein BroJett011_71820 [Chloroflexota bacterium]
MSKIPEKFEQNYELMEYLALHHISSFSVRTPLTAIIGYSELLLKELHGPMNEQQRAGLEGIHHVAEQLLEQINIFLDATPFIFDKKKLYLSDVNLLQVISSCLSQVQEKAKFQVIQDIPASLPTIKADEGQIYKALYSIVELVRQIHPTSEGRIDLSVGQTEDFITISFSTEKGEPLRKKVNPELFIAQSIIELHKGQLQIESYDDSKWVIVCSLPVKPSHV